MSRNPYAEHTPSGGSGSYLKFEDGKTVKVRIMSDPAIFDSVYSQGNIRQVSTKYAWLVWNIDENEAQIMQLSKTGFRALQAIAADEDYGNPMENQYDLKITRTGQKQQTKYNIVPVTAKGDVDEDVAEQLADIDLVARLTASPNNDRVAWLFDEIDGKRPVSSTKDTVVDPDDYENLDELPL